VQNGCIYDWGCFEPNPEMETTIAALSAGPVGPSDMIGRLNKSTHPPFAIMPYYSFFFISFSSNNADMPRGWASSEA